MAKSLVRTRKGKRSKLSLFVVRDFAIFNTFLGDQFKNGHGSSNNNTRRNAAILLFQKELGEMVA